MTEAQAQNILSKSIEQTYSFRQNKETGTKRDSVVLNLEVPTSAGIIALLNSGDEKVVSLIEDVVAGVVISQARGFVEADEAYNQEKANLDADKFTIPFIANLPKAERNVVGKEALEQFAKDYISIMPEVTGKEVERVTAAAGLFVEKFKRCAGDDEVLKILQDQLSIFIDNASAEVLERNQLALSYLTQKLSDLLSVKVTADIL